MNVDLSYARAATLLFPSFDHGGAIIQVGCGGTGSWLAQDIVRIARSLNNPRVAYFICDPDVVEQKNVLRQNFCDAEIGQNKAVTMASRLTHAWGVQVTAIPTAVSDKVLDRYAHRDAMLIVGCVDNAAARRVIHKYVQRSPRAWWLDCGNHAGSGQVLLGNIGSRDHMVKQHPFPGRADKLFSPGLQHPELLRERHATSTLSCAELTDPQAMTVNRMVAAIAADYIMRLLVSRNLKRYATYFDLASMASSSRYIPGG